MTAPDKLYRSARGSTVIVHAGAAASFTINYRSREEGISGWRSLRFRPQEPGKPPRLAVWCVDDATPVEIALEAAEEIEHA